MPKVHFLSKETTAEFEGCIYRSCRLSHMRVVLILILYGAEQVMDWWIVMDRCFCSLRFNYSAINFICFFGGVSNWKFRICFFHQQNQVLLQLLAEILHHRGCIEPCKNRKFTISTGTGFLHSPYRLYVLFQIRYTKPLQNCAGDVRESYRLVAAVGNGCVVTQLVPSVSITCGINES